MATSRRRPPQPTGAYTKRRRGRQHWQRKRNGRAAMSCDAFPTVHDLLRAMWSETHSLLRAAYIQLDHATTSSKTRTKRRTEAQTHNNYYTFMRRNKPRQKTTIDYWSYRSFIGIVVGAFPQTRSTSRRASPKTFFNPSSSSKPTLTRTSQRDMPHRSANGSSV